MRYFHFTENINTLATFCGKRDIAELTAEQLENKYGIAQADVFVLFGGSIMCGADVLAQAMKNHIAKKYVIVGGEGHTTETLRQKVHTIFPEIETKGLAEAEVFDCYLSHRYDLHVDLLECKSTNCGNNITNLLKLLEENDIAFQSIIITQDATMQHRMEAGLRKFSDACATIINYAAYQAKVSVEKKTLVFEKEILGMWDMERYISLLMGEIPRLTDNQNGYGPQGKDYIAHVDMPQEVTKAFQSLCNQFPELVRTANPLYG